MTSVKAVVASGLARLRGVAVRVPRAAYLCALVGMLNALAWSVITPPFEVPDENGHYAYVQQLAETGSLPQALATYVGLSPAEDAMLVDTKAFQLPGQPTNPAVLTAVEQQQLQADERRNLRARGSGDALSASANPPLYYALESVPFLLSPSGTVLNRLALMRALSAVFAGLTVLFAFMFLRELLPRTRWAWTVGALAVALQPLFAFISGGVNNDVLLYTFSAALFFTVARMFHRGLTVRRGLAIGLAAGFGLVTKFTLLGFMPGVALALLFGCRRARWRRPALLGAALAGVAAVVPTAVYLKLLSRPITPGGIGGSGRSAVTGLTFNFAGEVAHIWSLFLPRLPGMHVHFVHIELWHEWFMGLVGRFGWLDTSFPFWVYIVAAFVAVPLILAALADLVRERRALWPRLDELVVYLAMVGGLCVEIGVESYRSLVSTGATFEQPRYMLPALCIYAAVVALAARLPGPRWGLILGSGFVTIALAHDVFAQIQTIARYYT
jgi:4-amino-4-deoxy-L-arabinose transferase-like glycosyltransferase